MAQYTITGFDASAHMAEETHQASRMAAVGMYMSVVVSVIFGFILLVAVTFAVPTRRARSTNVGFIVPYIWAESMSQNWAEALLFICVVAQFFCVTASVTSASRMLFAFSRDGAVPGHRLWRRVGEEPSAASSPCRRSCVLSAALMIPTIWNSLVGYLVGTVIAVIGLYIAFILPVILRFRLGDRSSWCLEPRQALQVDRPDRDRLGRVHHDPLPAPAVRPSVPWEDGFTGTSSTTRR